MVYSRGLSLVQYARYSARHVEGDTTPATRISTPHAVTRVNGMKQQASALTPDVEYQRNVQVGNAAVQLTGKLYTLMLTCAELGR